eukprot:CAMPEP_0205942862 /NCGR_PEP_ID=MMETSP1325-20131115/58856_1 /ASSEMBLY_ACC=CAM_ASM_000708 /TAXON_ID=236786 /ORGANISM="Florenciella sp., Strain RCC1007" /LENGTH=56 /DNA_ID=CAMNT_0053313625 /DNA_START=1 /DNA_END=168 /DNA_ORIENTATION=-
MEVERLIRQIGEDGGKEKETFRRRSKRKPQLEQYLIERPMEEDYDDEEEADENSEA